MQESSNELLKTKSDKPKVSQTIKRFLKIATLSEKEVLTMRNTLLLDAKPIFCNALNQNDELTPYMIEYYDERINTLSKKTLFEMYEGFNTGMKFLKEGNTESMENFNTGMGLSYSIDGWFQDKLATRLSPDAYARMIFRHKI